MNHNDHTPTMARPTHPCRWARRSWLILRVGLLLSILVAAAQVHGGDFVVVLSGEAAPYRDAAGAIEEDLGNRGHATRTVLLPDLPTDAAASVSGGAAIAVGSPAAAFLHEYLPQSTVLVYCLVSHPAAIGLSDDPRAQGVSSSVPVKAQFELIAQALPRGGNIGMLYRRGAAGDRRVASARAALPPGWRLEAASVNEYGSIADAVDALLSRDVAILWTVADRELYDRASVRSLLLAALRHDVPVFGYSLPFVRSGALLGVGIDPREQGHAAATLAQKAALRHDSGARGAAAAPRFEIGVNMVVADRLSIDLPAALIEKSSYVIDR